MIPTIRLLYKLDERLNKLASEAHKNIPIENKILALNEAQIKLIKKKLNRNNSLQVGFDGNKKRYQDLENLVEPAEKHKLTVSESDKKLNKWTASHASIDNYMFYIDSYVIADKGTCKDRIVYVNQDLTAHANITVLLTNNHYKPSFEYQETFCTFSQGNEEIYTDGTFTPKSLYLSYLRYPTKIDIEGYEDFDGTLSTNSDCELMEYLEDELLNLTQEELGYRTENMLAAQYATNKIQSFE